VAAAPLPLHRAGVSAGGFSEDHPLAPAQAKLTSRAAWWAISCIQRDNASVASIARRLGVDWHTVWDAIRPLLAELADDPARLAEVEVLGVDEHLWHHTPKAGKGPKELTGMVDLTRHDARPQARLLDLVPGRSDKAYADWLSSRGAGFTAGVKRRRWIGSAATPTRSATNSKTPPPFWTPFMWPGSELRRWKRPAAGSSKNSSVTAAANTTRCIGSATRCAPAPTS
jgi:hypothetical protein